MSEEEKEAIETVKQYKNCFIFETVHEETGERLNDYSNAIDIVIKLINNQQKEIEQLNEIKQQLCNEELITQDYVQENFISKEKIRELLKEKEKQYEIYVGREYSGMGELVAEIKILEKILGD